MELFATAPGFDDPLGLLQACHQRIERHCRTLERLPAHLDTHGPDRAAREAAGQILRYFTQAAPHHHADEEQDLFPRLRRCLEDPECPDELVRWLDELEAQHREQEEVWSHLEPGLRRLALGGIPEVLPVRRFVDLYRGHMAVENERVLPLAARLLGISELEAVGSAMRARRGIVDCSRVAAE